MMNLFLRDRYWHLLCHRSELPQPGDFMRLQWLGDDVVAANEGDDIVVFDNVCPHRGARFFTEENGNSPITCPYHGWTYQSGQMHIPCSEKFKKQELGNVQLGKLQTAWCGDFLFVAPAPLKALDAQLGDLYEKLASISMDITARSDWNSYTYECDWKLAIENGLDSLHTPFVHGQSLGRLHLSDPENHYIGDNSVAYFRVTDSSVSKKLVSAGRLFSLSEQYEGYMSMYLFPFTMLTSTFGFSYSLQNFFPSIDPQKTNFYSRLLHAALKTSIPPENMMHFFASTATVNRQVFAEDHKICKQLDPRRYDWSDLTNLSVDEEKIAHFRRSLQKIAKANPHDYNYNSSTRHAIQASGKVGNVT